MDLAHSSPRSSLEENSRSPHTMRSTDEGSDRGEDRSGDSDAQREDESRVGPSSRESRRQADQPPSESEGEASSTGPEAGEVRLRDPQPRFETWLEFLHAGQTGGGSPEGHSRSPQPGGGENDNARDSSPEGADAAAWRRAHASRRHAGLHPPRTASAGNMNDPGLADQDVIDLRTPSHQSSEPPTSEHGRSRSRSSMEIVLPRWQPDGEVSACPICGKQFTFFYRKHHCRKCGRVVCALCSPHRITIPRQFIVHPPATMPPSPANSRRASQVIDLTGDDSVDGTIARTSTDIGLGGGEEVRICNPCVPDPNTAPPPQIGSSEPASGLSTEQSAHPSGAQSRSALWHFRDIDVARSDRTQGRPQDFWGRPRGHRSEDDAQLSAQDRYMGLGEHGVLPLRDPAEEASRTGRRRPRGVTFADHVTPGRPPPPYENPYSITQFSNSIAPPRSSSASSASSSAPTSGIHSFLPLPQTPSPHNYQHHHRHRQSPSVGSNVFPHQGQGSRYRSMLDVSGPDVHRSRPVQAPRPVLREDDYCPVCHAVLPPRGPEGDESAREAHVQECVATHFQGSGSVTAAQSTPPAVPNNITDRPLPPIPASEQASPSTTVPPDTSSGSTPTQPPNAPISSSPQPQSQAAAAAAARRRRSTGTGTRMITYLATEKDCMVNDEESGAESGLENGEPRQAECVICFEEFEVGVEMARLECLCKFHRKCIRSWWERKGGGCPVHQEAS
ncbi:MAG: hypothetical protein M4579_002027 [Chaenotheca gracillima]|nr:MAG: hypothetical protein M4579_002027 [Chaenotheca gracillima]